MAQEAEGKSKKYLFQNQAWTTGEAVEKGID